MAAASGQSSASLTSLVQEGLNSVVLSTPKPPPGLEWNSPRPEPGFSTQLTGPPKTVPAQAPSAEKILPKAIRSRVGEQRQDWREELSGRVDEYRKRRAHLQPGAGPGGNFELDFEAPEEPGAHRFIENGLGTSENSDSGLEMEFGGPAEARGEDAPSLEAPSREESSDEPVRLDTAPFETEMSLGGTVDENPPMEIMVDSPTEEAPAEEVAAEIYVAPLGRRFLAGLTDTLVLLVGAAVFGMIFWWVCGRLSLVPLNIAVLGFVAVILIFAYFGVFTAVASATPGLLWMGCEIRNLGGDYPTPSESFWRAFGVLVSASAVMLGFVWAWVDTDALTWHDRMSGTVITFAHHVSDLADVKAES